MEKEPKTINAGPRKLISQDQLRPFSPSLEPEAKSSQLTVDRPPLVNMKMPLEETGQVKVRYSHMISSQNPSAVLFEIRLTNNIL